jgi:hypothetical protein
LKSAHPKGKSQSLFLLRQSNQFQSHASYDDKAQERIGAGKSAPRLGFANGAPLVREEQEQTQKKKRQ